MRHPVAFIGTALLLGACASVLGLRGISNEPFEHRAHVLEGIACTDCHATLAKATTDAPIVLPTDDSCVECHEDPHDKNSCRGCHGQFGVEQVLTAARQHLRFAHDEHVKIAEGNCVRCHSDVQADTDRSLLPRMSNCFACHDHREDFEVRVCDGCHVDLPQELARPQSHVVHDVDFTNRHGPAASVSSDLCATCHSERDCASCHAKNTFALQARLFFDRPTNTGLHRANFRARHALEARQDQGLCMTCHQERSCYSCHESEGVAMDAPTGSPHPPGWVGLTSNDHGPAARRDPVACASCHGGPGEMLCVSCHKVGGVGGDPHPVGYESSRSLAARPCSLCHMGAQ